MNRTRPAGDPHAGLEAGPGEVDHGAAQHVPVLRGKHQRQVRPDQVPEHLLFVFCPETKFKSNLMQTQKNF